MNTFETESDEMLGLPLMFILMKGQECIVLVMFMRLV